KGGAVVRIKLKIVTTGKIVDKTFNAGVKVEVATVDKREMQYLYSDGDSYIFMDTETYDQIYVPREVVGDNANYLLESAIVTVAVNEVTPHYIELPATVEMTIAQTDPGLQGNRATGGYKPATLEPGSRNHVPA